MDEEREAKLAALRAIIEASIAEGGALTDDDLDRELDAKEAALNKAGF